MFVLIEEVWEVLSIVKERHLWFMLVRNNFIQEFIFVLIHLIKLVAVKVDEWLTRCLLFVVHVRPDWGKVPLMHLNVLLVSSLWYGWLTFLLSWIKAHVVLRG